MVVLKIRYELPNEGVDILESLKIRSFYLIGLINCFSLSFPAIARSSYKVGQITNT